MKKLILVLMMMVSSGVMALDDTELRLFQPGYIAFNYAELRLFQRTIIEAGHLCSIIDDHYLLKSKELLEAKLKVICDGGKNKYILYITLTNILVVQDW